jgi:hypothetical protein
MTLFLRRTNVLLLLCLLISFVINFSSLNYHFFQDDWFILNDLKNQNVLSIFLPRNDIIYYRPIGIQSFFLISNSIFGLNPLGFHTVVFAFFLTSLCLIYKLSITISGNKSVGLISALLYGTASFQFMALSWLSLAWNYIGLTFFLTSLIFIVNFRKFNKTRYAVASFAFFILCLFSTEFALVYPFFVVGIFAVLDNRISKKKLISYIKLLVPYGLIIILYLLVRFLVIPLRAEGVYKPSLSLNIIKDYIWYFLWTINLPEMFKYHLSLKNLSFSQELLNGAKGVIFPTILLFITECILLVACVVKSIKFTNWKIVIVCASLFVIGLAPVISLPHHSATYYLTIASLPVIYLLALLIYETGKQKNNKLNIGLAGLTISVWILLSVVNQEFNHKTHWVPAEEIVSKKITTSLLSKKGQTPKVVYIYPSSQLIKTSILDQQAMHLIYGNSVNTIYLKKLKDFKGGNGQKLIYWDK